VSAAEKLTAVPGVQLVNDSFFNEFTLRLPKPAAPVIDRLATRGVIGGIPVSRLYPDRPELTDLLLVAATETVTADDIDRFAAELAEAL
jgi:glycine dehydrogenase subunit 1